ncbi:hypothetical protein L2E82_10064 [Cichorium intybus]|uniref:Uncharacterized protein n=1 Tax=Cichorium intybus TaxID=13427 RepID=A0ACB9GAM3_CICIN|nr:hypothetical protein L2E82_10064 [Cichorium intybus]
MFVAQVAIKTLIVTLREGDPTFREELVNFLQRGRVLQLGNFKDDSNPTGWDCSAWVRTYGLLLEERLECFRVLKYDIEAEKYQYLFKVKIIRTGSGNWSILVVLDDFTPIQKALQKPTIDTNSQINNLDLIKERGYSRSRISSHAIEAYLIQILKTGFFLADPHPGNLAIDSDESLIYYDFGMMGEIKSFTRERLMDLFYAVYKKDAKKVMNSLRSLEALQPTGDMSSVCKTASYHLNFE